MSSGERRIIRTPIFRVGPGEPSHRQLEENAEGANKINKSHRERMAQPFNERVAELGKTYSQELILLGEAMKRSQGGPDGYPVEYRGQSVTARQLTEMFAKELVEGLSNQPEDNRVEWTTGLFTALRELRR